MRCWYSFWGLRRLSAKYQNPKCWEWLTLTKADTYPSKIACPRVLRMFMHAACVKTVISHLGLMKNASCKGHEGQQVVLASRRWALFMTWYHPLCQITCLRLLLWKFWMGLRWIVLKYEPAAMVHGCTTSTSWDETLVLRGKQVVK